LIHRGGDYLHNVAEYLVDIATLPSFGLGPTQRDERVSLNPWGKIVWVTCPAFLVGILKSKYRLTFRVQGNAKEDIL
jgi:hypothetical protein